MAARSLLGSRLPAASQLEPMFLTVSVVSVLSRLFNVYRSIYYSLLLQ